MTRFLPLSLVALALLGAGTLASCSDDSNDVAVTVNGTEVPQSAIDNAIDDLVSFANDCPGFAAQVFGEGGEPGSENVSTTFSATLIQERVVSIIINDEFEERNLELTDEDRTAAEEQFASQLGGSSCTESTETTTSTTADPAAGQAVFDDFSQEFQDYEVNFNAQASVLSAAMTAEAAEDTDITGADVRAYYDENPDDFTQNCAGHILVADEAVADDLYQQLQDGADFAALATANSTDTGSAANGGELGCQPVGSFVPEFEAAIDSAEIGEVTEPVQTEFGYHLILVSQKGLADFADVKAQIRTQLETPPEDPLSTFITTALEEADVEVNSRFGSWDADAQTVVPPEGPSAPSTTLPDLGTVPTGTGEAPTTDTTAGG